MKAFLAPIFALAALAAPAAAEQLARVERAPDAARLQEWRQRALSGDPEAMLRLGDAYRDGRGVGQDLAVAEDWYRKAAEGGQPLAADEYGLILFRTGRTGEAIPCLVKAAERGDARAQYIYGTALFNGDYVARDWVRAYAMMTRAAAGGIEAAANSLQQMNRYIPADQRKAGAELANAALPQPATAARRPAARPAAPERPVMFAEQTALPPGPAAAAPPPPRPIQVASLAPPPKPRPAAAAAPQGKWQVQLGAFGDEAKARALWATLKGRLPALAALAPHFVPAGAFTRLRAGPVGDRAAAERLCAAASAKGQACFPVAP